MNPGEFNITYYYNNIDISYYNNINIDIIMIIVIDTL